MQFWTNTLQYNRVSVSRYVHTIVHNILGYSAIPISDYICCMIILQWACTVFRNSHFKHFSSVNLIQIFTFLGQHHVRIKELRSNLHKTWFAFVKFTYQLNLNLFMLFCFPFSFQVPYTLQNQFQLS